MYFFRYLGPIETAIIQNLQFFIGGMTEAATGGDNKKSVLKNFAKFTGKHLC